MNCKSIAKSVLNLRKAYFCTFTYLINFVVDQFCLVSILILSNISKLSFNITLRLILKLIKNLIKIKTIINSDI